MSTMLEKLEKLDPAIIDSYRKTGHSDAIPSELQQRIIWYTTVTILAQKSISVNRASAELLKTHPEIKTQYFAKKVYYEALQFFHVDNSISNEVWDDIYAEKFDKLAALCIADNRFEAAGRYLEKAYQLRTNKDSRIKLEDLKPHTFIITNKIKVEDLGFKKVSLHDIATKYSNGAYRDMINKLPISEKEKNELFKDAEIIDDEDE